MPQLRGNEPILGLNMFHCDKKYSKGNKCGENKLIYIDCVEEEYQELELPQDLDLEESNSNNSFSCIGRHQYSQNPQDIRILLVFKNQMNPIWKLYFCIGYSKLLITRSVLILRGG
jgi:hypothetical protein